MYMTLMHQYVLTDFQILASEIRGLKVVMPDNFDVKAVGEAGQIGVLTSRRGV